MVSLCSSMLQVMVWPHTLPSAPQYLAVANNTSSDSLVLTASQSPPETHCFHVKYGDTKPVRSQYQPWRLSTIRSPPPLSHQQLIVFISLFRHYFCLSLTDMSNKVDTMKRTLTFNAGYIMLSLVIIKSWQTMFITSNIITLGPVQTLSLISR